MTTFLTDPQQDLSHQLTAIATALTGVVSLRANYRELAAWLRAWEGLLTQVLAEGRLGQVEGEDQARRDFLLLAEQLARAAVLTLTRARVGQGVTGHLTLHPVFRAHLDAWHALRGVRQGVSWSGQKSWTSGRLPILRLDAAGERLRQTLTVDVLEASALTWTLASGQLNTLAEGLQWRV